MKYYKLKISAIILMLGVGGLHAQEAVLSSGGDASGSGGTAGFSVGQIVFTSNTGATGSMAQGVQQAYEISSTLGIDLKNIQLELSVYPNPTSDYLILKIEDSELTTLSFQLIDMQGKLIEIRKLSSNSTRLNMNNLPSSIYFLNISNSQKTIKTFKIIKN